MHILQAKMRYAFMDADQRTAMGMLIRGSAYYKDGANALVVLRDALCLKIPEKKSAPLVRILNLELGHAARVLDSESIAKAITPLINTIREETQFLDGHAVAQLSEPQESPQRKRMRAGAYA
jgi:hypothetical protein